jgi:DNA (cytosine-5)-methyltransferase 1
MKPIVVVDLFCGMGGFTQGAIDAGANVILSVDAWDEACDVHEKNHPGVRIDCIQLGNPEWYKGLLRFLEPYRRTHHIHLHGSPPCQALSNASSRNPEEGMPLVIWFLNLVKSVQPGSWSMENVIPVRKRLPEGTPSVTLNSADFGVAQTRRRCYAGSGWVAEPTHTKEEWVSVIQALPHLTDLMPVPSMTEQYKTASKNKPYPTVTSHSPKQLRLVMDSGRASAASTGISKDGKKAGGSGPLFRDLNQPSYTQMTSARRLMLNTSGGGSSTGRRVASSEKSVENPCLTIHNNQPSIRTDEPKKIRSLTLEETLTLQGFSPDYDLSPARTMKSRWTMVGNAVPPPVAEAVIRGIQNAD